MNEFNYAILAITLWNVVTFMIYGVDKRKAICGKRRISEKTLLLCGLMMGGIGALFGMSVFRHKTKHLKFKICVPIEVVLNIAVVVWFIYYMGYIGAAKL